MAKAKARQTKTTEAIVLDKTDWKELTTKVMTEDGEPNEKAKQAAARYAGDRITPTPDYKFPAGYPKVREPGVFERLWVDHDYEFMGGSLLRIVGIVRGAKGYIEALNLATKGVTKIPRADFAKSVKKEFGRLGTGIEGTVPRDLRTRL